MKIGYTLSSEEFKPKELIKFAKLAEDAGFDFLIISDHYHPWLDKGESAFVWEVIGALSQVITKIPIGTGVTAPILRYHPAVIAQAAMTAQVMLEGRFLFGVGTGENLNEHIIGAGWPAIDVRRAMLIEAIEIMRQLWKGGYQTYHGSFYEVEDAQIYTMHDFPPPILVSAFGKVSAKTFAKYADGFVTTTPDKEMVDTYKKSGGKGDIYGQMSVCFAKNENLAQEIIMKEWPLVGLPKPLNTELRKPIYFEKASELIDKKDLSKNMMMGIDKKKMEKSLKTYKDAGFTHAYIHNIGPNQEEFIKWFGREFR